METLNHKSPLKIEKTFKNITNQNKVFNRIVAKLVEKDLYSLIQGSLITSFNPITKVLIISCWIEDQQLGILHKADIKEIIIAAVTEENRN